MFIAVDGIDGAGKTTLVAQLGELLRAFNPLITKEPTNTSEWGRALRDAAVRERLPREVELEYFHKDRLHHLASEIIPALRSGRVVICDRYVDSTLAFQAHDPDDADSMYEAFRREILIPDLTFILDCPVDTGLARIRDRKNGFSTFENFETLRRAQEIYRSRRGPNYVHIDASKSIEYTLTVAQQNLRARFPSLTSDGSGGVPPAIQGYQCAVGSA